MRAFRFFSAGGGLSCHPESDGFIEEKPMCDT